MSTKKDERFVEANVNIPLVDAKEFPPEQFNYGGIHLTLLGASNKQDLIPVNFDTPEMAKVVTFGSIGQYVYSSQIGDLYDACIYKNQSNTIYMHGIRTRQLPDAPKKQKAAVDNNDVH